MKYIGYLTSTLALSLWTAFAKVKDSLPDSNHGLPGQSIVPGADEKGLSTFFSTVVSMLQDFTAIAAVLGVCIVGIMYIMSRGDEEKTESAKNYMVAILIGVVLAFTAWAIISLTNLLPSSIQL